MGLTGASGWRGPEEQGGVEDESAKEEMLGRDENDLRGRSQG